MAQPTPAPAPTAAQFANPLPVISTQYCTPHPVNLAVVKKVMTISDGDFVVTDTNNTVIFKVEGKLMTLHDQRVLLDAAGKPIVTCRQKIMTAHHRWNVYRGKSKEPNDLIFTIKQSSMIQLEAKLHVFLANNTEEEVCDFMVEGTSDEKTCVVYTGDRTKILAKMEKETTIGSALIGKDNYLVTVQPNVDYAFIVVLIVILDDMNYISDSDEPAINIGTTTVGLPTLADFGGLALGINQTDGEEPEKDEDVLKTNDEVQEKDGDVLKTNDEVQEKDGDVLKTNDEVQEKDEEEEIEESENEN